MNIIAKIIENSTIGEFSSKTERFNANIEHILSMYHGNIIEIGAGGGRSTIVFLRAAKIYGVKVLVIDPWEPASPGDNGYNGYPIEDFDDTVKDYISNLVVHRTRSTDKSVPDAIKSITPIAFAFVDGWQSKEVVLSDLKLVSSGSPPLICVDDINRDNVAHAVNEFIQRHPYEMVKYNSKTMECYLQHTVDTV